MRQVLVPRDLAPAIPLRPADILSLGGETMGTTWSVKVVTSADVSADALRAAIVAVLDGVIGEMSTWIAHSDISRFNRAAPGSWIALPKDFITVLRCALRVAADSGGAYDPTIGALVALWGFGPHGRPGTIPADAEIAAARRTCGWQRVTLDGGRAFRPGGVALDLSSVAKGFAVDKLSAFLAARGLAQHLVEIGGELIGRGVKPDRQPWWVGLEAPSGRNDRAGGQTVVALHNLAVATSGDAQRFFAQDGRCFSHTIDPRTGWPVSDSLAAVTVLHRSCMWADALATALVVLGPDAGFDYAAAHGLSARFMLRNPQGFAERMTPAMAAMLE
jgi:FAD:protein FMN transferase